MVLFDEKAVHIVTTLKYHNISVTENSDVVGKLFRNQKTFLNEKPVIFVMKLLKSLMTFLDKKAVIL